MTGLESSTLSALAWIALTVGVLHTLAGPDHYLPFIALAKARGWSMPRTLMVTGACGLGHVMGSSLLGAIGIGIGAAVGGMEAIESMRGDLAGWSLIVLGFAYTVWGIWHAIRGKTHTHAHVHADGSTHDHEHGHLGGHTHPHEVDHAPHAGHEEPPARRSLTVWALFIVFVLGPCEALIPTLMVPALAHDWSGILLITSIFGLATIGTMIVVVAVASLGISWIRLPNGERYAHVAAGVAILGGGLAIQVLGL